MKKKGLLLVNLGTPKSPTYRDVARYLNEFLSDPRVIDIPWLQRHLLVKGVIIPLRVRFSSSSYKTIWTEEGSPLMVYSQQVKKLLEERLGEEYHVELAMRYQNPSIGSAVKRLLKEPLEELTILPLFPQYASATTGSIFEKVSQEVSKSLSIPHIRWISHFYNHPSFIEAFKKIGERFNPLSYDHVIFSFHGLPERQLIKSDVTGCCLKKTDCCTSKVGANCYANQCYQTAALLAKALAIPNYTLSFQSRLGREPWIAPYTQDVIEALGKKGVERVLVFCPAFVSDCLETLFEIGIEYKELFHKAGGKQLDLVPSLNAEPSWIEALEKIVKTR